MRVYIGFHEDVTPAPETKDRWGFMAYVVNALQYFRHLPEVQYQLVVDGKETAEAGAFCLVNNVGSFGWTASLPTVGKLTGEKSQVGLVEMEPTDGLLDLFVFGEELNAVSAIARYLLQLEMDEVQVSHYQGRQLKITADPPQGVLVDGEPLADTPLEFGVRPGVLPVIVPREN